MSTETKLFVREATGLLNWSLIFIFYTHLIVYPANLSIYLEPLITDGPQSVSPYHPSWALLHLPSLLALPPPVPPSFTNRHDPSPPHRLHDTFYSSKRFHLCTCLMNVYWLNCCISNWQVFSSFFFTGRLIWKLIVSILSCFSCKAVLISR